MKTALITGAARNIGRAIAKDLADHGYRIAIHYHTSETAAVELQQEIISATGTQPIIVQANLTKPAEVQAMVAQVGQEFGKLDALINTVGNFVYAPLRDTSAEQFDDVWESNVRSVFLTTTHALPLLKKAGVGKEAARIVNFGSASADQLTARIQSAAYTSAKAAVISLTKSWAKEVAEHGITVNCVSPGIVENSIPIPELPLGKPAQFSDIVNAVQFLLKPESSYISGANIEVAGAWTP